MSFPITNIIGFETGNDQEALSVSGSPAYTTANDDKHSGLYGLELNGTDQYIIRSNPANLDPASGATLYRIWGGIYIKFNDVSVSSGNEDFIVFENASGVRQMSFGLNASGKLVALDQGGTVVDTGTFNLVNNTWYKFEWRVQVSNTFGFCRLYINEATTGDLVADDEDFRSGDTSDHFPYQVKFQHTSGRTGSTFIDDIYFKMDNTGGSQADLIGVGDNEDWNIPRYYQAGGSGHSTNGAAPDNGSIPDTGENPFNDSNEAEWTGSSEDSDWATDGSERAGPGNDITDTVLVGKYWYRVYRGGGGGTTHILKSGYYNGSVWTNVTDNSHTDIGASPEERWYVQTTNIPSANTHYIHLGIEVSGGRNLHIIEAGAWILQHGTGSKLDPPVVTNSAFWWLFFNK